MNATTTMNVFNNVFTKGNEVFVTVNAANIKEFREAAASTVEVRKTKRYSVKKTADRVLFNFIRDDMKLKGKHIRIHVLTPTDKTGLFRNQKGRFVKIDEGFQRVGV